MQTSEISLVSCPYTMKNIFVNSSQEKTDATLKKAELQLERGISNVSCTTKLKCVYICNKLSICSPKYLHDKHTYIDAYINTWYRYLSF